MRVLFLSGFYLSGQTTHAVELARALRALGHAVWFFTRGRAQLPAWRIYEPALRCCGVETRRFDERLRLIDAAVELRPEVVHCHSSTLLNDAAEIGRRTGAPVVFTAHGVGVSRRALTRADWVIAVGPKVEAEVRRAGAGRVALIGNGVDLDRFSPGPKERTPTIAYVGRVDTAKRRGLAALVQAARRVGRLHVASNDWPQGSGVTAHGWLADVAPLLRRAHVVVGTGRAIREGMASGCVAIVLGSRYGGVVRPKSLPDGAFPSFPGDAGLPPDPALIQRDLVALFQNRARLEALARWSRKYAVRHFSLERMARRVAGVYACTLRGCAAL